MAQFGAESFTGTEGAELSAHNSAWTKCPSLTGDIEIASNRGRCSSTTSPGYYHSGAPASADYQVTADLTKVSAAVSFIGLLGRQSTSANTCYRATVDPQTGGSLGNLQLFKFVAGVATQLGSSVSVTYGTGTTKQIKLEMVGSAIKVYWDGSGSASVSVTDTAITAAGKAGVRGFSSTAPGDGVGGHITNFSADDIGGAAATQSESASAAETADAANATSAAAAESGSVSDTASALLAQAATQSESVVATDTANGLKATVAAVAESVTSAETNTVSLATAATQSETATAAESQDASVTSASGASCSETASASDASSASLATTASAAEAATAADIHTAANATIASQSEAGTAVEASSALRAHAATGAESAGAADTSSAVASGSVSSVSETAAASDVSNAVAAFLAAMIESAAAQDIASAVSSGDVTPVADDATGYYRRAAAVIMSEGALGPSDYVMLAIGNRRSTH